MSEEIPRPEKKVDEEWLKRVEEEKGSPGESRRNRRSATESQAKAVPPKEVNFSLFLSTLALQAYVALGELEEPESRTQKVNLDQARYMIDILGLIQNKTKGNLSPEEERMLSHLIYELRMKYIEKSQSP